MTAVPPCPPQMFDLLAQYRKNIPDGVFHLLYDRDTCCFIIVREEWDIVYALVDAVGVFPEVFLQPGSEYRFDWLNHQDRFVDVGQAQAIDAVEKSLCTDADLKPFAAPMGYTGPPSDVFWGWQSKPNEATDAVRRDATEDGPAPPVRGGLPAGHGGGQDAGALPGRDDDTDPARRDEHGDDRRPADVGAGPGDDSLLPQRILDAENPGVDGMRDQQSDRPEVMHVECDRCCCKGPGTDEFRNSRGRLNAIVEAAGWLVVDGLTADMHYCPDCRKLVEPKEAK